MGQKSDASRKNALSRLVRGLRADWRSLSRMSKFLVTLSWAGTLATVGVSLYFTRGTFLPPIIFYSVVVSVGLLTGTPALRVVRRELVVAPPGPVPPRPEEKAPEVEPEKVGLRSRLSSLLSRPISERARVYVIVVSAVATLVLVLIATFVYPGYQTRPGYDNTMMVVFVVGLLSPSVVDLVDRRYKTRIDSRIPDFLREIGEAQRTGTPFTKSLVTAAESNYGPLSVELKRAVSKMSWGMTFEEALDYFAANVDTPLAHRAAVLLKEVGRSGGKMLEVLDAVYEHVREVINLKKERSKQLTPYVLVIYASFGVYLFVVYILFSTFFAQVANLQASGAPFGSNINPSVYYIWFFHMSVIEGVVGGTVIGKISSGSFIAGTKHILILLIVSILFFTLFVKY